MKKRTNFQKKTKCNSEKRVLTCRVLDCKQELLAKNYRQHLLSCHPAENPQDLSPFGQSKLSFFSSSSINTLEQVKQPASTTPKRCGAEVELIEQPIEKASKSFLDDVNVHTVTGLAINSEDAVKEIDDSSKLDVIMTDIREVKDNLALLVAAQGKSSEGEDRTKAVPQHDEKFDEEMDTLLAKVTLARSMTEIELTGFVYDSSKNELRCSVCAIPQSAPEDSAHVHTGSLTGIFAYDQKTGLLFSNEENLPEEFRNLKNHLKRHIKKSNLSNVMEEIEKQQNAAKRKGNNYEAGMNLGRACMKLYLRGRPYTDYEHDVLNLKQAKAKIGHMNHSRNFPAFSDHMFILSSRENSSHF